MTPRAEPAAETSRGPTAFDPLGVRADFPILATSVYGKPLVYLDNGATTQKPRAVIERIDRYYETENANIHRGVYHLSQVATEAYESARRTVQRFLNAPDEREVIFTRGTTEAINLVAASFGRAFLKPGDEILVTALEHHSNIVPWQLAAEQHGAKVIAAPINDEGELLLDEIARLIGPRTKMVAVNHVSNALGTINDVRRIAELAHAKGAKILVDGAQWVAHFPTDVRALDCDFYCFSGHKLFGPTGIGILWGRKELLEAMPPYQGGGDMIERVSFEKTTYAQLPNKFEAGTPDIAGAVGLAAAIDYLASLGGGRGFESFHEHETDVLAYATAKLGAIPGLRIIGRARQKTGAISFVIDNPPLSALDLGTALDREGIAVRTGHHCCMPLMERMGVAATTRASFALYNTREDVDRLVAAVEKIVAAAAERHGKRVTTPASSSAGTSTIEYPAAVAATPREAGEQILEEFEFLGDDQLGRTQFLLELGDNLPSMPADLKNEATRVTGCMSTVHLAGRANPRDPARLDFLADSDADIVRGLIAVLESLFAGQKADDILAFDMPAFFKQLGLDQIINMQRRNGLEGMVRRIRGLAAVLKTGGDPAKA